MKYLNYSIHFVIALCIIGCVSLNVEINFPAEEVKEDLVDAEKMVRTDGESKSLNFTIQSTAIKPLLETRKERYQKKLLPYYDKGLIGEGQDGYLAIRNPKELDLRDLSQIREVVDAENQDRLKMYNEILKANDLEANEQNFEEAKSLIFGSIKESLKPGHYYQTGVQGQKMIWGQM